jgi:hypothetical protein
MEVAFNAVISKDNEVRGPWLLRLTVSRLAELSPKARQVKGQV